MILQNSGFNEAYSQADASPLTINQGNTSAIGAATTLLLMSAELTYHSDEDSSVSHLVVVILMSIELAFAFFIGLACIVMSGALIAKVRVISFPLPDELNKPNYADLESDQIEPDPEPLGQLEQDDLGADLLSVESFGSSEANGGWIGLIRAPFRWIGLVQ